MEISRKATPRDMGLREEVLSKILKQAETWTPSEIGVVAGHVKEVALTGTGFSVWVFRRLPMVCREFATEGSFRPEEAFGSEDLSDAQDAEAPAGSSRYVRYRGRLQTPNNTMHLSDDTVEETVEVTGRTTLELSAKLLAQFFKVASNPCTDCGLFSALVQRYDVGSDSTMLCRACALSFVSGVSVQADCAICLGQMLRPFVTECNHLFHRKCLASHLAVSSTCPLCRADWLSEDDYHRCARPYSVNLTESPLMGMTRNAVQGKRRRIKRPKPSPVSD